MYCNKGGATKLAGGLAENHVLQEIDLSRNGIDEAGTTKLAQTLACNEVLQKIDFGRNAMGFPVAYGFGPDICVGITI